MCFNIDIKNPKPITATKPIVCFKRIRKEKLFPSGKIRYSSPYRDTPWNLTKDSKKARTKVDLKPRLGSISRGYHSYTSLTTARKRSISRSIIVQFIIPKGTKYYYNSYRKEYVSETIRWVKIIK